MGAISASAPDTAVVVVSYGDDPVRIRANSIAIGHQLKQNLPFDYYLVEMLPASGNSAYADNLLQQVHHLTLPSTEAHKNLFQKEALMNTGWRQALARHAYDFFIFCDADIYATDPHWFAQIRERLCHNPGAAEQGYRLIEDSVDKSLRYSSLAAAHVLDYQTDITLGPGFCWALGAAMLQAGDGFNDRCFIGSGDCSFVMEYLNAGEQQYETFLDQFHWYQQIHRELPFRAVLDGVPVDLIHAHHGELKTRNYDGSRYLLDGFAPAPELIARDSNGLLVWRNPDCGERRAIGRRSEMTSREQVRRILAEEGVNRPWQEPAQQYRSTADRPVFVPRSGSGQPVVAPDAASASASPARSTHKLFDPSAIFGKSLPYSWCANVERSDTGTGIPVVRHDQHWSLALVGADPAADVIACLPLTRKWAPGSLTGFQTLSLLVDAAGPLPPSLHLQWIFVDGEGAERKSPLIPVDVANHKGWRPVSLPLSRLLPPDWQPHWRARHLNLIAAGSARLFVARIRLHQ